MVHCDERIVAVVVGFRKGKALMSPSGLFEGLGCRAEVIDAEPVVWPSEDWLGRLANAPSEPGGGKGPLPAGDTASPLYRATPPAHGRQRVGQKRDLGVRALNTFVTCRRGQRMGIFAGSALGKSVLLSMLAC